MINQWTGRLWGLWRAILGLAVLIGSPAAAWAQLPPQPPQPVTVITAQPGAGPGDGPTNTEFAAPCNTGGTLINCTGRSSNITYQGNNQRLESVQAGGQTYRRVVPLGETVIFRRSTNPLLPNREVLFFEYPGATPLNVTASPPITLTPSPVAPGERLEDVMLSDVVNRGIDNVFNNAVAGGQDTRNNVQRIDYIVPAGITAPVANRGQRGFLVFERGGNDNFRIAAITGLTNGAPSSYGPLIPAGPGTAGPWGGTGTPDPANNIGVRIRTMVSRRDLTADPTGPFRLSHIVDTQNVRGIFFSINSLVPDTQETIFGYSLFANDTAFFGADPLNPPNLVNFDGFPVTTTGANAVGGLDLVAGGFGLFTTALGDLALVKRITGITGPASGLDYGQVLGTGTAIDRLRATGLGQGLITVDDPAVTTGNQVEYTVYFANTGVGDSTGVVVCDQIPAGLTFVPDGYGPGRGIQAIAPSAPPGLRITFTNAADGDAGQFIPPGAALPAVCGINQGNGAVVVNLGTVGPDQVGLIAFRVTVD